MAVNVEMDQSEVLARQNRQDAEIEEEQKLIGLVSESRLDVNLDTVVTESKGRSFEDDMCSGLWTDADGNVRDLMGRLLTPGACMDKVISTVEEKAWKSANAQQGELAAWGWPSWEPPCPPHLPEKNTVTRTCRTFQTICWFCNQSQV